jgi:hypothetical protein
MSVGAWIKRACASSVIGCSSLAGAADADWHYTLDQLRGSQQANFCDSRQDAEETAGIFERFGPKTGYSALSSASDCAIAVRSCTPRKLLTTVTISEGTPGEYLLHFVEVEDDDGKILYLVTTRDVATE